ncbi:MAG TPA: hypothetical protein VMK84_02390 [Streptosporangiaceae bacterium]|nr:hypothetical protein [Streptosporangiaceae bacterium]
MSTWSSGRSDGPAPSAAETGLARRTATRPYIEGMIEALRQAGISRCCAATVPAPRVVSCSPRSTGMPARWSRWARPLTEQGKPNRPEIRRLGRELAARDRQVTRKRGSLG